MRLVDADLLMEKLNAFNDREHGNEHFLYGIETAKELLEEVPTAYDVEKVVEQIKREQYDITECSYERGFNAMARFAQKVVRKCGVE